MGENAHCISKLAFSYRILKELWINCSQVHHLCSRCNREQIPGSVLFYIVYILDGEFRTEYQCLRC